MERGSQLRIVVLAAIAVLVFTLNSGVLAQEIVTDGGVHIEELESQFFVHPLIIDGALMVPIRDVADRIGLTIQTTNAQDGIGVTCCSDLACLSLKSGSVKAQLGEQSLDLPRAPIIIQGKLLVPIRIICDSFGLTLDLTKDSFDINGQKWVLDPKLKRIIIDKSKQRLYAYEGEKMVYETHTVTGTHKIIRGRKFITPSGYFTVTRTLPGKHIVKQNKDAGIFWTGVMYNSLYFSAGPHYAIHGSTSMPSYPASHGCCRVSLRRTAPSGISPSKWLHNWTPEGTAVWIFDQI